MNVFCLTYMLENSGHYDNFCIKHKLEESGAKQIGDTSWLLTQYKNKDKKHESNYACDQSEYIQFKCIGEVHDWVDSWADGLQGELFFAVMRCVSITGHVKMAKAEADVINSWFGRV